MQHLFKKNPTQRGRKIAAVMIFAGALSTALSNVASATVVGELVLVGGQCPAGFIPLDGRTLSQDEYPELAAVLGGRDVIDLPTISPRVSVSQEQGGRSTTRKLNFVVKPIKTRDQAVIDNDIDGPVICEKCTDPKPINGNNPNRGNTGAGGTSGANDLGSLQPQYCIATGGDTPQLVEIGLRYVPESQQNQRAFLEFARVNVSGYAEVPDGFKDGDIDLDALQKVNPGIGRPNLSFVLVGENACIAKAVNDTANGDRQTLLYPGELRMSGVQIARGVNPVKDQVNWGNDFEEQSRLLGTGDLSLEQANFSYTNQRDENGRPGFLAVDIIDDRKLILETRNVTRAEYQYRVQAQCGDPGSSYNVYYDPVIRANGGGGTGFPY